jgi:2-polyprenyl-6-methoxyphenol hydroxylase-like FAD-dependent oxidoreductase
MRIAINGAGIAGPALAYWLAEAGHQVLLVEQAPSRSRQRLCRRLLGRRVRST